MTFVFVLTGVLGVSWWLTLLIWAIIAYNGHKIIQIDKVRIITEKIENNFVKHNGKNVFKAIKLFYNLEKDLFLDRSLKRNNFSFERSYYDGNENINKRVILKGNYKGIIEANIWFSEGKFSVYGDFYEYLNKK